MMDNMHTLVNLISQNFNLPPVVLIHNCSDFKSLSVINNYLYVHDYYEAV